jgi:acyl carrier protein
MTDEEILTLFTRTLRDLLGDDTISLGPATTRSDVPGWDSFAYVTFIAAIEMELGIRFRVAAVESFANVGEIVAETRTLLRGR